MQIPALPVHRPVPSLLELSGKVDKVTVGDTIMVLDADKTQCKIRLEGIDTPESEQAFGIKLNGAK